LAVAALATALALVAILLRWRGSDLPAHFFRVGLVERDGFKVWNNFWFGGHHTLGYGVLFPVLGAAAGIWAVAVASAGTSAYLVDRLLLATTGERRPLASLAFAAGTVTNVAIGRLPFALGLTIGVAALLALARDRPVLAALASAATSTASPVVSVFLAIVYAALAATSSGRRRRTAIALGAAAVVPVVAVALLYPQGGTFPFRWTALVWVLVAATFVALEVPIARGWERQLDMRFHPQFYEPGLTAEEFHRFLLDGGVGLVALPDARLDDSGVEEAALVEAGLAYLRPVWADEGWRLWEVVDATGLVDGDAEAIAIESDRLYLRVRSQGDVVVRQRASALWATDPPMCVEEDPDGWILLRDVAPGDVVLYLAGPTTPDPCPP
jgi:hypothetical protein